MNVGKSRYGQAIRPRFRGTKAVSGRLHWPQGYNQILEEVGVPEKHRLYHLRWVRQFLSRSKGRDWMNLGEPESTAFLEHLQETPSVEGWQVQQAKDAIVLYLEGFYGIELGDIKLEISAKPETPGPAKPPKPELVPPKNRVAWKALKHAVQSVLRSQHYSRNTEQTYFQWMRKYVEYHGCAKPSELDVNYLSQFLRHLAIVETALKFTQNQE